MCHIRRYPGQQNEPSTLENKLFLKTEYKRRVTHLWNLAMAPILRNGRGVVPVIPPLYALDRLFQSRPETEGATTAVFTAVGAVKPSSTSVSLATSATPLSQGPWERSR